MDTWRELETTCLTNMKTLVFPWNPPKIPYCEHDYDPSTGVAVISWSQNSLTIQPSLSELLGGERNYLKMKMWMVQEEQNPYLTSDSYTHAYTYAYALIHIHAHTCTHINKWTCTHIPTHGCAHMNKDDVCMCSRTCMNELYNRSCKIQIESS